MGPNKFHHAKHTVGSCTALWVSLGPGSFSELFPGESWLILAPSCLAVSLQSLGQAVPLRKTDTYFATHPGTCLPCSVSLWAAFGLLGKNLGLESLRRGHLRIKCTSFRNSFPGNDSLSAAPLPPRPPQLPPSSPDPGT